MSRWVSLILLLAIIALTGVALYRVMSAFVLPLFLASVLAVIFRPLHVWVDAKFQRRPALAALATTAIILVTVLAPVATIAAFAVREGFGAIGGDVLDRADHRIGKIRRQFDLEMPFRSFADADGPTPLSLTDLDQQIRSLPDRLPVDQPFSTTEQEQVGLALQIVQGLNVALDSERQAVLDDAEPADDDVERRRVRGMLESHGDRAFDNLNEIQATLQQADEFARRGRESLRPEPFDATPVDGDQPLAADVPDRTLDAASAAPPTPVDPRMTLTELRKRFSRLKATYEAFRIDLLGGALWAGLTDLANPNADQMDALAARSQRYLRSWLPSVAGQATAIVGHVVLGLAIMSLAVFYFLKDGPAMISTLMKLSPLDDRYERELLVEFDKVSRAVVLATLLSAVAQGLLAGIAYLIAQFDSVFLLTSLTIVLAMVPFVGAAAVWFPACLWLALVEERLWAGGLLFIYGVLVISMVDNLLKPYVLHGQSKLHPLLALLSVLGGVQALGPIGILVGPMVVSFLQALLNILHHELQAMDVATQG